MRWSGPAVWRAVAIGLSLTATAGIASCGEGTTPSPFAPDGGGAPVAGSSGVGGGAAAPDAGPDPTLGGPCVDDRQCDDGLDCTDDFCDMAQGACRFLPVHTRCIDDIYCDGFERCEPGVGCRKGEPIACSDGTTCTIDRCVEATRSCEHVPRDADGDGDPVWNCGEGGDCDDTNPRIHSGALEVCDNGRDDDCDGDVDEADCTAPQHDSCVDPLLIEESGRYALSLASAREDIALDCVPPGGMRRDVVAALVIPEGFGVDVDVTAISERSDIALGLFADCSDQSSGIACVPGAPRTQGSGRVARTILRGLDPGTYPLFVSGLGDDQVLLAVSYGTALPVSENETCGTASSLIPGQNVELTLASTERDVESACGDPVGDVVFSFELEESQDVAVSVAPLDDNGEPIVSLRDSSCTSLRSELACRAGAPSVLFARALPAGTYFVAVGATGPADVNVRLDLSAPTEAPPGEGCLAAPKLSPGGTVEAELFRRSDAIVSTCLLGATDATYALSVPERSDVLLVERVSTGDTGAVSLMGATCESKTTLACSSSSQSPVRARAYAVPAGEYRAIAESKLGSPVTLSAMVRPAKPTVLVSLSDSCEDAARVDESGGRFVGNTRNAHADFEAGCDFGGGPVGGAPDQMLHLVLSEERRVVLDMEGSQYETLLVVRRASACPGPELENACAPGYRASRSFLDLILPAGEYWIQIDGFDGDAGAWELDVFTAPP